MLPGYDADDANGAADEDVRQAPLPPAADVDMAAEVEPVPIIDDAEDSLLCFFMT